MATKTTKKPAPAAAAKKGAPPPARRATGVAPAPASSGLMAALESAAGDLGLKESRTYRPVSSGINVLDYFNGRYFMNHETNQYELFVGIPRGKMIGLIGYTGAGKTTLAVQMGYAIVQPYEEATVFHFDLENAWSVERTADIVGEDISRVKAKYRRFDPVSLDKIYEFVKRVIKLKTAEMANPKSSIWTTDEQTGEKVPTPTVILIDTVAALQSDAVMNENVEMGSLMFESGSQAKHNNAFAQRLAGMIGDPNITVIWVNHIRDKVENGPVKKAKRVQYLGADETVPGGHGFPQYADYYLKLVPCEALKEDEGFRIHGKAVRGTILKSRLSYDGRQFELVLSDNGFTNGWSNLNFLKNNKLISGAGAHLFITDTKGRSTRKFSYGEFYGLYEGDQEFREIVDDLLEDALLSLIPQPGSAAEAAVVQEGAAAVEAEASVVEGEGTPAE